MAEAHSCLTALAEAAADIDASSHYEPLLIELDLLHSIGPGLSPISRTNAELFRRFDAVADQVLDLGEGDQLSLRLLLIHAEVPPEGIDLGERPASVGEFGHSISQVALTRDETKGGGAARGRRGID